MKNRTNIIIFFLFTGIFLLNSCKKEQEDNNIPTVAVSFSINPNSTEYIELNVVGGWIYLTGGYRGILVYRKSADEFMAYDRACPYDWSESKARIVVDTSGLTASCPSCKSKYILLDGSPYKGPSTYSLKQYQTSYDGQLLYIYN
ncbi:MAG: hypothetical protein Q8867_07130 [Bacteroidota bacterium]|nr:hypothetical protein [Bacteroidota bacterium]